MGIFYLKENDTQPILEVTLKNPDLTVHDPTGSTVTLNIWLSDGTKLTPKSMTIFNGAGGIVRYTWLTADWGSTGLVAGPSLPLAPGVREHRMEYQVDDGTDKITFPNNGWDTLRVYSEAE